MTLRCCIVAPLLFAMSQVAIPAAQEQERPYPVVGTGQTRCYDNWQTINPPRPGEPFYGQDAQHPGRVPSYRLSSDKLTVLDLDPLFQRGGGSTKDAPPAVGESSPFHR